MVPSLPGPEAQAQPEEPRRPCTAAAGARDGGRGPRKGAGQRQGGGLWTPCAREAPHWQDKTREATSASTQALSWSAGRWGAAPKHMYFLPPPVKALGARVGSKTSKEAFRNKTEKERKQCLRSPFYFIISLSSPQKLSTSHHLTTGSRTLGRDREVSVCRARGGRRSQEGRPSSRGRDQARGRDHGARHPPRAESLRALISGRSVLSVCSGNWELRPSVSRVQHAETASPTWGDHSTGGS